jgi:uncharacterized membrane protein
MSRLTRGRKESTNKPSLISSSDEKIQKNDLYLDEYKLATQVQQGYYDLVFKCITAFYAITALCLGFVFRESISEQLKTIFCWFNLAMSVFFVIGFTGFYIISNRVSRRMDQLAVKISFELGHHHALNYGIFFTLVSGVGVLIFWIAALVFRFWAKV